ncbi:VOC family protein [Virgibacillus proomii]|uniref:VOC family protein n=1 Tax=Virgibacillus proomii TaxID=84407 RepID=UPI001C1106AE|nr:VOC family protein [Virgibacillus proomii]MBU5265271.1 VOC family protein [Virgibacillus proomii]
MKELVSKLDTIFLQVNNLKDSLEWYQKIFNLEIDFQEENYIVLKVGETPLTLMEAKDVTTNKVSRPIFYFYSKNIEDIHGIVSKNAKDCTKIKFEDGVHFFEFKDNVGNPLGVCSY